MAFDWKSLLSAGIGEVVAKAGEAIDRLVTSDAERLALKNALKEIELGAIDRHEDRQKELDIAADEQATSRLQADMASDNKWSKNIRPMSFAYTLWIFTVMVLLDGNVGSFQIRERYIEIFMYLLLIEIGFYFSSRGLEKIADIISRIWVRK